MMMNNGFEQVLCDELIPYIDKNFLTKTDRNSRAMAGLSMGGFTTQVVTLARPEVFGYYGLLSGGSYTPQDIKDLAHDILRHRILLSYEAEAANKTSDNVIDSILSKVPVP